MFINCLGLIAVAASRVDKYFDVFTTFLVKYNGMNGCCVRYREIRNNVLYFILTYLDNINKYFKIYKIDKIKL